MMEGANNELFRLHPGCNFLFTIDLCFGVSRQIHGRRIVTRGGLVLKLTPTEYSLLRFLARHAGKVVTHTQIIHELWGPTSQPDTSYVRVYVLQLRRKIEQDPANPRLLITEPGVGYRLISGD